MIRQEKKQFEKQPEKDKEQSILEDEDVKDFVETRNIRAEDFELIEKLYTYPQEFFIVYHNLYNFAGEKTAQVLDQHIQKYSEQLEDAQEEKDDRLRNITKFKEKIEMTKSLLEFVAKYDWHTVRHLNGLLEEKAKYQTHIQKQFILGNIKD